MTDGRQMLSTSRRARRFGRRLRGFTAASCVVVATAGAGIPVFVHPQIDSLRHADAVIVLGGFGPERDRFGIDLAHQGWAPVAVLSSWNPTKDPVLKKACESPEPGITKICIAADPSTTLGEGRELRRLAAERGWHTVIVVTSRPHISRARYILEKCFDGHLTLVEAPDAVPAWRWPLEYVYQSLGYVRAVLHSGC